MEYVPEKRNLRYTANFLIVAGFFLAVVFLTPHSGSNAGQPFFSAAWRAHWAKMGDWMGVWSSVKIMFFSLASLFLLLSVEEMLLFFRRHRAANALILTLLLPVCGFGIGLYYLVKSVL
jgi:hypothetical protein